MSPLINWDDVPDEKGFTPLPAGQYKCKVSEVKEKVSSKGDEMWSVFYEVVDGDYIGRKIFDNIVFSEDALKRAKFILHRMGIALSNDVEVTPDDIREREVFVTVELEDYVDPTTEETKTRNKVPWGGFESIEGETEPEPEEEKPKPKVGAKGKVQPTSKLTQKTPLKKSKTADSEDLPF